MAGNVVVVGEAAVVVVVVAVELIVVQDGDQVCCHPEIPPPFHPGNGSHFGAA